jgi:hypothetical protein
MLIEVAVLLSLQAATAPLDPLTKRIQAICRYENKCITRQREGMRQFFRLSTSAANDARTAQRCLGRSASGWLTDWIKAEKCLRRKTPARAR